MPNFDRAAASRLLRMPLGPGSSELTPTMRDPPRVPARSETVTLQFAHRVDRIVRHGLLLRDVAQRLDERLALIRLSPTRIADVGCGRGEARTLLQRRYPQTAWIGIDACLPMVSASQRAWAGHFGAYGWAQGMVRRFRRRTQDAWLCASADALPLGDGTVDLLWSNLMPHWHPTPHVLFPEWKRVLRGGGLLMFSAFGPDTLKELRSACLTALPYARPMPFVDMHDFGDMLVAAGFSTPVMDVERISLTYPSAAALLREVRALGGNPRDDRFAGLASGAQGRALYRLLEQRADVGGRIALSFEVVFGHAWRPEVKRTANEPGVTRISVDALRQQLGAR